MMTSYYSYVNVMSHLFIYIVMVYGNYHMLYIHMDECLHG